jgi:hypothetical protein
LPSQEYRILNDIGFTIETGETDYFQQTIPGQQVNLLAEDGTPLLAEDGRNLIVAINDIIINTTPRVDFSLSYDGGATFGNDFVTQFKFWGMGRFVVTDGIANVRM